jgi:hypothetical protein
MLVTIVRERRRASASLSIEGDGQAVVLQRRWRSIGFVGDRAACQ